MTSLSFYFIDLFFYRSPIVYLMKKVIILQQRLQNLVMLVEIGNTTFRRRCWKIIYICILTYFTYLGDFKILIN